MLVVDSFSGQLRCREDQAYASYAPKCHSGSELVEVSDDSRTGKLANANPNITLATISKI